MTIGGGVLLLLVGAGALMFFLKRKKPASDPVMAKSIAEGGTAGANARELDAESELEKKLAEQAKADLAAIASLKLPTIVTRKGELLSKEITDNTKKDASVPAHVLQTWLHEND
jgi:hypothetical protein